MKTRLRYYYHRFMAWRLNRQAAELSQIMRRSSDPQERSWAATELLKVGARSNVHERMRDVLGAILYA